MINFFAKSLVLIHTFLSLAGMTWAIVVVLQVTDFGRMEPYKEVLEYTKDGAEKVAVRHASAYDKSQAVLIEAGKTRDQTYAYVKPAIDSLRFTEPFLWNNHLAYVTELKRLNDAPGAIEVKRLQNAGTVLEPKTGVLGKPLPEDKALDNVNKSAKEYQAELKMLQAKIGTVEEEIRKIVNDTKKFTADLTGTDETNKYREPGLYKLIDLEFKAQTQVKAEIEDIKPGRAKALDQASLYLFRRLDLEASLETLKGPAPKKQ